MFSPVFYYTEYMVKRAVRWLLSHEPIFFLLVFTFFLRVPNLFEPYWYGDEAIYLTLGNALKSGLLLYRDIIDHKTPVIYLLATVPSEFWFKMLLLIWSLFSVGLFYAIIQKMVKSKTATAIATLVFILLTTLPAFEGNVANGELFLMGFILAGLYLFTRTSAWSAFAEQKQSFAADHLPLFASGVFLSLAVLTKVPAVFDIAGIATAAVFLLQKHPTMKSFKTISVSALTIAAGFAFPILMMIIYFAAHDATSELLQFALLYNFRYSQSFSLPFQHPTLLFVFSMKGKLLLLSFIGLMMVLLHNVLKPTVRWVIIWFALAMFSTLLSSRPYPHYFIQTLLPLSLFAGLACDSMVRGKTRRRFLPPFLFILSGGILVGTIVLLKAGLYPTFSYYTTFFKFATKQISLETYRESFDPLMRDTYAAAEYIGRTTASKDRIFIWGTDPMLYALSRRNPAGRFTVSFHIKDFDAYGETMDAIRKTEPPWIVVMDSEDGEFPELYTYIQAHYIPATRYPSMTLYRRFF